MNLSDTLNNMTVVELRKLAAQFHIAGRSKMTKAQLVRELNDPDIADVVELSISVAETDEITADTETMNAIADAEAGDLLDAALGEYVEPVSAHGEVAIMKYSANDAVATAAFDADSVGGHVTRERGRWVLRDNIGGPVRAKTLNKVAKLWAKRLGFHATAIDVATMS